MIEIDDFEYVNPILKTCDMMVGYFMEFKVGHLEFLAEKNMGLPFDANEFAEVLGAEAKDRWNKYFEKIQSQVLPLNLVKLLEYKSRDEQFKLLRGVSLTSLQLLKFIFEAWEKSGCKYSFYKSAHNHNGINNSDLPEFALIDKDKIYKIGETEMTDGEIKHAINFKKMTIAKFIDGSNSWHCFFYTLKSIEGKERGWQNEPHMHYISDKWGISRDEVIFQLKSKNYKLPSKLPHINFTRSQNEKSNN